MSVESGVRTVLVVDREKMKRFTRLVHTFASRSTEYNLQKMMEAGSFLEDLEEESEVVEPTTHDDVGAQNDGDAQNEGDAQE